MQLTEVAPGNAWRPSVVVPPLVHPPVILILDRDAEMLEAMRAYLDRQAFEVLTARDLDEARAVLEGCVVDLVVLGSSPGACGLQLYRSLMANHAMPSIVLSEDADAMEKILALEVGADELLERPCNHRELLARIRALLRRAGRPASTTSAGSWVLNRAARTVTRADGKVIYLTPGECALLDCFCDSPGVVISGETARFALADQPSDPRNALRTTVVRLRRAIGDDSGQIVRTVRGRGYLFAEPLRAA